MTRHSVARAAHQNMNLWGKSFKRTGFEYKTQRAHRVQGYLRSPVLLFLTLCSRSGRGVWFSCWSVIIRFYPQATDILTISLHHYVTFCILERRASPLWLVWDLTAHCVLCKVYFSSQPNKLRPILKFEIGIPLNMCLSQLVRVCGKYICSHFCDFETLDTWFPLKYVPVSSPSSLNMPHHHHHHH